MADRKPVKLLDISGNVWMEGISLQPYISVGGVFKQADNFDPFEEMGIFIPSKIDTRIGSATVTVACAYNVGWQDSSFSYFYAYGDNTLYKVKTLDDTVTDVSGSISGMTTARGAIKFKGKFLYANDSTLKSQPIPVTGVETTILSGLQTADHSMHIGPDRNCYMTNKNYISKITNATASGGNTAQYLTFEDDVITRDLTDDGRHLVIAGDNKENAGGSITTNRCFIGFWNMKSQDLTAYYEVPDDRIFWCERVEDDILVMGRSNIYICNIDTPPKILMPTRGNTNLGSATGGGGPGSVVRRGSGVVLWGSGSTRVYGYGRSHPSLKRIFFTPYSLTTGNLGSLYFDASKLYAFDSSSKLYDFGTSGAVRQTGLIYLSDIDFKKPYEFAFAKVLLRNPLDATQTVSLQISTLGGNKVVMVDNSLDFTTYGAKMSCILEPKVTGLDTAASIIFEDLTDIRITNTKAEIRRIEIWGYPVDPSQNLMA